MIRRATVEDVPQIVEWGGMLHATGPWAFVAYQREAASAFATGIVQQGAVFMSDAGMCGGAIFPMVAVNPDFRLATEFFWWAPMDGQELRQAFEDWARAEGATGVLFSALSNERLPAVTRIYRRAGFFPAEVTFAKRFA